MTGEELKEYNIKHVVEKALECFELYGIEETTMKIIAKKAGLTTRTIQRYFHSKENLTLYVLQVFLSKVYHELKMEFETKKNATENGLEQLKLWHQMIQQYLRTNFKDMNSIIEIELYIMKKGENSKAIKEYTQNVFMIRQCTLEAIRRGISDKSMRADTDAEKVTDMILGAHFGLLNRIRTYQTYNSYPVDLNEKELTDSFDEMVSYYLKA